MKKIALLLILTLTLPCWAINDKAGTTAATFLKLGVGARALGLANAYTAVSGDSAGFFVNPAGSAEYTVPAIFTSASQWIVGTKYGSLSYIHPFRKKVSIHQKKKTKKSRKKPSKKRGKRNLSLVEKKSSKSSKGTKTIDKGSLFTVGLGVIYFNGGSVDQTGIDAFDLVVPLGTQGKAVDQAFIGNISKSAGKYSLGVNGKYIKQVLGDYSASAYAADAGIIYHVVHTRDNLIWDTGIAYHNAGTKLDFREDTAFKDELPTSIRLGNFAQIKKMRIGLDLIMPSDNDLRGNLGFEYEILEGAAFRLGFKPFGYDELGDDYYLSNMTVGFGIPFYFIAGRFDYAFVPMGDLGTSHHVSLTVFLKKPEKKKNNWFGDEDM